MSREESTQYAFDAYCKRLVKNGAIDIHREYARQEKREVVFSELTNRELSCLQYMDYYALEQTTFDGPCHSAHAHFSAGMCGLAIARKSE